MLHKKAFRSMWQNKNAYIACIALICIGVMMYMSMGLSTDAIAISRDRYYEDYRLADIFSNVRSVPKTEINKLTEIEGIEEALGRQVYDARLVSLNGVSREESDRTVTIRLVSVDSDIDRPLNGVLFEGNDFSDYNDIMMGKAFFEAYKLQIGDSVELIVNGRIQSFSICAAAQSPEYVYTVKPGETLPDPKTYDVAFIKESTLFTLTGELSSYNDMCFRLANGYKFELVKSDLEDRLSRFGLISLTPREDQYSCSMVEMKIDSNGQIATTVPFVFIGMSSIILYLMLKRMIEQERVQLGTLKAFGYSDITIILHYMMYGFIIGIVGGLCGLVVGYYFARMLNVVNGASFSLPNLVLPRLTTYIVNGMLIALAGSLLGSFAGAKAVLKLNPAEAMRPVAPKTMMRHIKKNNIVLDFLLNSGGRMAVRSITRDKLRSLFIILGVMFSSGMITLMAGYNIAIDDILLGQFTKIQLYDGKINYKTPVAYHNGLNDVRALYGVTVSEGLLELPVDIKSMNLQKSAVITGLPSDSTLLKIHDSLLNINLTPQKDSIILSASLADKLNIKKGDICYLSSTLLKDDVKVIVYDTVSQSLGQNIYIDIDGLADLFQIERAVSSVLFQADDMTVVKAALVDAKNIASMQDQMSMRETNQQMMGAANILFQFLQVISFVAGFGIIYSICTISLSERKREYTTLRVIGMQNGEIAEILSFENGLLSIAGIILGVPFASFLCASIADTINMDMFTLPRTLPANAYVYGAVGCVIAVLLTTWTSANSIKHFDMVEVLKDRE